MLKRNACYLKNNQTFSENITLIFVQPYAKSKVSKLKTLHLIIRIYYLAKIVAMLKNYNDICKIYDDLFDNQLVHHPSSSHTITHRGVYFKVRVGCLSCIIEISSLVIYLPTYLITRQPTAQLITQHYPQCEDILM